MNGNLALHETLELHEMSAFKVVCLTKAKTMQILVSDPDLKNLLRDEAAISTRQLKELDELLARATEQEDWA